MTKTLCIHPDDRSTDFLRRIYQDKDWDVITGVKGTPKTLMTFMQGYDRIIMMGHGTPEGLLNTNNFYSKVDSDEAQENQPFYVIGDSFADLLKQKQTVSIWCHSDQYARRHKLPGFHTGMIISEVSEAEYVLGKTPLTAEETLDNMNLFADVVAKYIDESDLLKAQACIRTEYNRVDPVSEFNRENIIMLDADGKDLKEEICQTK